MKNVVFALIGLVMGVSIGTPALAAYQEDVHNPPKWMSSPCKHEDSPNCFWDAAVAGNGKGYSFYSIRFKNRDCVAYWDNKVAKKHNRCYKR